MKLKKITSSNDPLLAGVPELYESAFPLGERTTTEHFIWMIEHTPEMTFYAIIEDDAFCGMVAIWDLGICRYLLYLATLEACRNKGYGAEVLKILLSESELPIIAEVEHPVDEITSRRIAFYERNGFHVELEHPAILSKVNREWDCDLALMASKHLEDADECQRRVINIVYESMKVKDINIAPFQPKRIDEVARMAAEVWGHEENRQAFTDAFCGHLARYSLYSSELALQMEDEIGLQAIAFAWTPGDANKADRWLETHLDGLTPEEADSVRKNVGYLKRTDAQLQAKMEPGSAKLSFFISRKPGLGTPLLERLTAMLRERGYRWLYLWTDSSCNWQYYPRHNFEQIGQGPVPEFCTADNDYQYFLFRKRIV
ncbi:MAG: GNAT family N-acetyltransferase [Bacteroidales bacterium]|nr:GNAT family N-acetyltransferase [Bacteroidales bacterium]